jgi:hypothetical protein
VKRRGGQRVRFTIERKIVWQRLPTGVYEGQLLSEPAIIAYGHTLADLRRQLVDAWRCHHDAIVKPTGRPPSLAQDRRSPRR